MVGNIIAGIVVVALIGAGVWMWWIENGPKDEESKEEPSEKKQ